MSTTNEHTAMIYIHWSDHTDRYTPYKVPYEIAIAIDKLLEKNQVKEKSDYRRYGE